MTVSPCRPQPHKQQRPHFHFPSPGFHRMVCCPHTLLPSKRMPKTVNTNPNVVCSRALLPLLRLHHNLATARTQHPGRPNRHPRPDPTAECLPRHPARAAARRSTDAGRAGVSVYRGRSSMAYSILRFNDEGTKRGLQRAFATRRQTISESQCPGGSDAK